MAQNITLLGASYTDVPAVELPKTGGGTATFTDTTPTTASASDVLQGKYFFTASGVLTLGTGTGGSGQGNVWQDAQGYVNLDDESGISMQTKSVSPTESAQTVTPDSGYTGLEQVNVGAISSSYVGSGVTRQGATTYTPSNTAQTITSGKYLTGNQTIEAVVCSNLTAENIKNGVTVKVGTATDDDSVASVTGTASSGGYDETLIKKIVERGDGIYGTFEFPNGLTKIGAYAFCECYNLFFGAIPNTVTAIGAYALRRCQYAEWTNLPSGVTTIGEYAFQQTSVAFTSLPSGITRIENSTFFRCSSLRLTSLPSGVTYIGSSAFNQCGGLTSISCSGIITTLGSSAFLGTSNYPMQLTSASFPNMALASNISTVFGSTTAANACQLLEFCDIGSTTGIAASAFANCYALETLVLRKTSAVCTLANVSAFLNTPMRGYDSKTGTVYVPEDLISSYQTATNWSTLYNDGTVEFKKIEGSQYEL